MNSPEFSIREGLLSPSLSSRDGEGDCIEYSRVDSPSPPREERDGERRPSRIENS
jgi:hypothetical protein